MTQPSRFEAYSLEEICNDIDLELGSQHYDYLTEDIIGCEMDCCSYGMEYALIYLKTIIDAMDSRIHAYGEDPDQSEINIINALRHFLKDKDEYIMVYIQGA